MLINSMPLTVLIIEDETMVRYIARLEFEDAGFKVMESADATSAVGVLETDDQIDLLFTDIRIPGALDGWAVARLARRLRPNIAVIYATGYSPQSPDMVTGALFFGKPYKLSAIIQAAGQLTHA